MSEKAETGTATGDQPPSASNAAPPAPPTDAAAAAADAQTAAPQQHFQMEITIPRSEKKEPTVQITTIPGPDPKSPTALSISANPNLSSISDAKWKAHLVEFATHTRRTGTLPDEEENGAQRDLYLWYQHAVREYGRSKAHRKSTLTKPMVAALEEEAGFVFAKPQAPPPGSDKPTSSAASAAEDKKDDHNGKEDKEGSGGNNNEAKKAMEGNASPRIRIKIPKIGATAAGAAGAGASSGKDATRSTPKFDTPLGGETPLGAYGTPRSIGGDGHEDAVSNANVGPEAATADDDGAGRDYDYDEDMLPIVGTTLMPAQQEGLERSPPDGNAMAVLIRRFTNLIRRRDHAVDLDDLAVLLGVPKRRLWEVVQTMEGIGVVELSDDVEDGGGGGGGSGCVRWLGAEGMKEAMGDHRMMVLDDLTGSNSKRKWEGANELREEIGKLYEEESVLDAWIHKCRTLPHYTDRPFLYCKAGDIVRAAQTNKDGKRAGDITTLAIRAPPGGVLEVTDPVPTHSDPKKRRYEFSVSNKTAIAPLPLPPPPAGDSTFDAAKFKETLRNTNVDLGETSGVGGISGNPVQVYHLSSNQATTADGDAMDIDGKEDEPPVNLRKVDVQTNLKGDIVGPAGLGIGSACGLVMPEMLMNADVKYDADTLCLRDDEGASSFFE